MTQLLTRIALAALSGALAAPSRAQSSTLELLDAVIARVETNYAGYVLEVAKNSARAQEYAALCDRLRQQARSTQAPDALALLRDFIDWFDDGHLFVQEYPSYTPAELAAFRTSTPRRSIAGLAERLRRRADELAALEGLWFTPDLEIAIEREGAGATTFTAVVLKTRSDHWSPGEVLAEFDHTGPDRYAAVLRMDDHSPRRIAAELKGPLLHMPPYTWGRRLPLAEHDRRRLDPDDPRAPCFRVLDDEACVISLPSLAPAYGKKLNKLCVLHRDEITARNLLIIDLRGNEGGSSTAAQPLAPFFYSERHDPPAYADAEPHVLSCSDTVAYYDRMQSGFFTPGWLRSVRKRLKAQPGQLIPLYDPPRRHDGHVPKRVSAKPAHVAVLIDGNVVSAGEAFVLEARRHDRVRTFGSPTGGMIDYQNVTMVAIGAGSRQVVLGYPVIAASAQLPVGGFNRAGIAPDAAVEDGIVDLVAWVRAQYR